MSTRAVILLLILSFVCGWLAAQNAYERSFTLNEVIEYAQNNSPQALIARHNFRASYWDYKSIEANYLPLLNLYGTLGGFDRSLTAVQNSETGQLNYVSNNNMRNSMTLSASQRIPLTGGTLSVYSRIDRLDQFSPINKLTYNSQPINVSYIQPLRGFNPFKWDKRIGSAEYERAKREYLEAMEYITLEATNYFYVLLLAQKRLEIARKNYANTTQMLNIANERFSIGGTPRSEILQLELRLINDGIAINDNNLTLEQARFAMRSFLGLNDMVNLAMEVEEGVPDVTLNYYEVLSFAEKNSSFSLRQEIALMNARMAVERAQADRGFNANIDMRFGLTQQGDSFLNSLRNPRDLEIISLGFSLPLLDWGRSRGRVRMAQSREEVARTQADLAESDFRQRLMISVMQFNQQSNQYSLAMRADAVANERYEITLERFANGTVNVLELNTAQSEKDNAVVRSITEQYNFWRYYYTIRQYTLYDFIDKFDISAEFDTLIEN